MGIKGKGKYRRSLGRIRRGGRRRKKAVDCKANTGVSVGGGGRHYNNTNFLVLWKESGKLRRYWRESVVCTLLNSHPCS